MHTHDPLEIHWISRAIAKITWTEGNAVEARPVSKIVLNEKETRKRGWRNEEEKKMYVRTDHHSIFNGRQFADAHLNIRSIAYTVIPWPREYKF